MSTEAAAVGKEHPRGLPVRARLYIACIGIAGLSGAISTFHGWTPHFTVVFFVYLVMAVASSEMKVMLPGVNGSLSVNYVSTLLAMLQFQTPETLLLATIAVTTQTILHAKTSSRILHVFFNISSISLTVLSATYIYRQPWFVGTPEGQFIRLLLACVVYFMMNALSVCIVIALTEGRSIRAVWKECYSWSFPFYLVGASLAEMVHLSIERLGWTFTVALIPFLYGIYRFYKLVVGKMEQERLHAENVAALHLRTIETLAMAIEVKDQCTHDHLRRVQVYSLKTAELLGLSDDEIQALRAASILHDIGKLAVPDYIISKPGKLTPEEFEKMKIHTVVGARIVEQVRFPYEVAPIVRSHHEKWDGTGYPDGLKAETIPIGARILSAVDCLDALATDRQYRRALPLDEAMAYVVSLAGRSFDPDVVDILNRNYREFEKLAQAAPATPMLDTDVVISRGSAPDAGFQKDHTQPGASGETRAFAERIASARQELQTVVESIQEFAGSLHLDETLAVLAQRLKRVVPYDSIAIWVRDGDVVTPRYINGEGSRVFASLKIPAGQGISGWVVEHRKAILNGNPSVEPAYLNDSSKVSGLNSALAVPLAAEQLTGALTLYRCDRDAFARDDLRLLLALAGKISRALERIIRSQRPCDPDALDELTGLPNAKSLYLRLEAEIARCDTEDQRLTIIVCDLDGFGHVNDRFGQLTGNELLKNVGHILKENCRDSDTVARMGGDEFILLLPGANPEELDGRIGRIDRAIREACREICGDDRMGISIGIAAFPEHGTDPESLLSHADNDMHRAKRSRKAGNVRKLPRVVQVA